MCGICGKLNFGADRAVDPETIEQMSSSIRHRGPDDEGAYFHRNVGLGHRRLTIVDLNAGRQPLSNEDGTVWVVFNGEIYNFVELRERLIARGHRFETHTDSEVLVHLYEDHGPSFVEHLIGMFAFALYDEREERLMLARDRVGIKPLYYALTDDALLFGSEIKAILADPTFPRRLDSRAVDRFLKFYYVPGDATLLEGLHKLRPGHYLTVENGETHLEEYWDLDFTRSGDVVSLEDAAEHLDSLLGDVVEQHLIGDVPVGFLLSGGIDSTALLSHAVERADERISTFTIGFDDASVTDERPYARIAAEHFGTDHHEITISPERFRDFLPQYVWHMEEPVCEPPAIALFFVSQLAREHVKVVLSGEGGDEAFGGYSSYRNHLWLEQMKCLPRAARAVVGGGIRALQTVGLLGRYRRYVEALDLPLREHYHSRTSSPFHYFSAHSGSLLTPGFGAEMDREWSLAPVHSAFARVEGKPALDAMLYVDTKTWLPDDLLLKADKITMANSLELRVPLLDHRVLEYAASLPPDFKVRGSALKRVLRQSVSRRVPEPILTREKAGFPVPYASWMMGNLNGFVREILLDERSIGRGQFDPGAVERLLGHGASGRDYAKEVFSLVVLELWQRSFLDRVGVN